MARTVGSAWKAGRGAARSLGRCCHPRGQEQARLCQHDRARNTGPVPLLGALMRNTWQAQFSSKNWNIPGDAMGLGGPRGCPETVMGPSTGRAEHAALRGPEVADSGVPSPWAPHRFRSVVGLQLAAKGRWAVGCAAPERPGVEPKPGAECAAPPPAAGSPESEYFSHFHHLSGPAELLSCQAAPGEGPSLDHPCRNSPPPAPTPPSPPVLPPPAVSTPAASAPGAFPAHPSCWPLLKQPSWPPKPLPPAHPRAPSTRVCFLCEPLARRHMQVAGQPG